jgi:hypothetical protein
MMTPREPRQLAPSAPTLRIASALGIGLFAFVFCWRAGHRGVFLFDQSLVFDGGWRMLSGQVLHRDFTCPFGPTTFALQAGFFWLTGVNWSSMVLPAALMNALGALMAMRVVHVLTGGRSLAWTLAAGLGFALTFQAGVGTLWFEQTALFFCLAALTAAAEAPERSRRVAASCYAGSGLLLVVALLAKQNAGGMFIPIVLGVALLGELGSWRRAAGAVALLGLGAAAGLAAAGWWIWTIADPRLFLRHAVEIPAELGRGRLSTAEIVRAVNLGQVPLLHYANLAAVLAGALVLLTGALSGPGGVLATFGRAAFLAIALPFWQNLFQASTLNEPSNMYSPTVLALALAFGMLPAVFSRSPPHHGARLPEAAAPASRDKVMRGISAVGFLFWLGAAVHGGWVAWTRRINGFDSAARFSRHVGIEGLKGVVWGEPTLVGKVGKTEVSDLTADEFEALVRTLEATGGARFFVAGESTLLYGLLGSPSPGPLLFFVKGQTYLPDDIPEMRRRLHRSLEQLRVQYVVSERSTFMETKQGLADFGVTDDWLRQEFRIVRDFGHFQLYERVARHELVEGGLPRAAPHGSSGDRSQDGSRRQGDLRASAVTRGSRGSAVAPGPLH